MLIGWLQLRHLIRSDERRRGKRVCASPLLRHLFLVAAVDCLVRKFESPVCEVGLTGSRFKDRELGAIEADERRGAEADAADGVSCFDVGSFCDGAGC